MNVLSWLLKGQALAEVEFLVGFRLIFGFLWGQDPSKCNAQAARCTGGVKINGWDRISLHRNLVNLFMLNSFLIRDIITAFWK